MNEQPTIGGAAERPGRQQRPSERLTPPKPAWQPDPAPSERLTAARKRDLPAEIGGYSVVGQLGHGSYGAVFRVRRAGLLRDFALKVLPASLHPDDVQRFRREARLVARLDHPHVVRGIDFGRDRATGWQYLVLDLVEGPSLKEHLKAHGPLDWRRAAEVVAAVARAVDYAHQQGVIHRDLKPANVLLDRHGFARVTDFGLARDLGELTLTAPGEVLGTPYYMSRDQVQGTKATPGFDVHALGVILYELVTGERPFRGGSVAEVVNQILETDAPPPSARAAQPLPPGYDAICARALSHDPLVRYPSALALAEDLDDLRHALHAAAPLRATRPSTRGLPAAMPLPTSGPWLGAMAATAILLPLLTLSVVWGWSRGRRTEAPAPTVAAPAPAPPTPTVDVPRELASILGRIKRWDLARAALDLIALRPAAQGSQAQELESLTTLLEAARTQEADAVARVHALYVDDLRGRDALDLARASLRAHPDSAGLTLALAHLLAVSGETPRAQESLERALTLDPALQEDPLVELLGERLSENAALPPTPQSVWQSWRPYQGGLWREEEGALYGVGRGLGDFDLGGLLLLREAPVTPPYALRARIGLAPTPRAYGGFVFGAADVGQAYLAYVVREPNVGERIDKLASDEQREAFERAPWPPLLLRVARLIDGRWHLVRSVLLTTPDPGETDLDVLLAVHDQWIQATVNGVPARQVKLPTPVAAGEVGVLEFFGEPVRYRDVRVDALE